MIRTQDILKSLPLLASVLGNKYGVEVIIGGDHAYTNGQTIYLPSLPLNADNTLLSLARSFLDHEAAHIRYTDFTALKTAKLKPFHMNLWNSLEDWRVEKKLAEIFPGCKQHFRWLIEHHFNKPNELEKNTQEKAGQNPAFSVLNWILLSVRAWEVAAIAKPRDAEAKILNLYYPGLLTKLESILDRIQKHCPDTQATINYALELAKCIERYVNSSSIPTCKPEQSPASTAESNATTSQAEIQENTQQLKLQNSTQTLQYKENELQQLLQALCNASTSDLPEHLGETLAQTLTDYYEPQNLQSLKVAQVGIKSAYPLGKDEKTKIMQASVASRIRLQGLLQAQVSSPCLIGRLGKLYPQKLHAITTNNSKIFLRQGESKSVSTAVHLLLDCSNSMHGKPIQLAAQACYALAMALQRCHGVNVGITAFPASYCSVGYSVATLLRHGTKVHDKFNITTYGSTPLGEALWWVMQQMYPLREHRKIICILSDGVPDSVPIAKQALQQAKAMGLEVMGLGIDDNNLESLLSSLNFASQTIHSLSDLAPALFGMLQKSLLNQGDRV